jgi:hypothetical protein
MFNLSQFDKLADLLDTLDQAKNEFSSGVTRNPGGADVESVFGIVR